MESSRTIVKASMESSRTIVIVFNHVMFSIDLCVALIFAVQIQLLKDASSKEESSAICSSIVGQANLDTIAGQLMAISSSYDPVSLKTSISDLTTDIFVGRPHN